MCVDVVVVVVRPSAMACNDVCVHVCPFTMGASLW